MLAGWKTKKAWTTMEILDGYSRETDIGHFLPKRREKC
jgi:hypothetical protein